MCNCFCWKLCEYFFVEPLYNDKELQKRMWNDHPRALLQKTCKVLQEEDLFTNAIVLKNRMKTLLNEKDENGQKYKMKELFLPLRYAVSGTNVGADLMDTMILLGQQKCVDRLSKVLVM